MAWVQSSPKGGIRQGYSTHYGISTKFHRSPLPGRLGRLPPSGVLPRKERGVRASDHCPIFLSVGAPAEEPSGPLEHPPKRVRQGKPSGSRRPQGGRRGQFAPSGSSISSSPLEHPPKRVRQEQEPSGSRRPGGRRGQFAPSGKLDFIFPAEGRQPREDVRKRGKHKSVCLCGLSPVQWLRFGAIKAQNLFHKGSE